jgi:hypothetical protein
VASPIFRSVTEILLFRINSLLRIHDILKMRLNPTNTCRPERGCLGNKEKVVSECYFLRVETSRPRVCEKDGVEIMYHLQQPASGRKVSTTRGSARGNPIVSRDLRLAMSLLPWAKESDDIARWWCSKLK